MKNSVRIAHISDIHYRGLNRHDEYRLAFINFFQQCRDANVDYIVVTGDTFHTKTQGISPEVIDELNWFFTGCAGSARRGVHVILGNHDLNLTNRNRKDVLSPILRALNNDKIVLHKDSGSYPFLDGEKRYRFGVYSCIDEDKWPDIKPVKGKCNIALFHGCVHGSETDADFKLEGDVGVGFFNGYDVVMLGDIHKAQFLTIDQRMAYPGSAIMQSYGESGEKGFLLWDIKPSGKFNVEFREIPPVHPFVTLDWTGGVSETVVLAEDYLRGSRFRIRSQQQLNQRDVKALRNELSDKLDAKEVVFKIDIPQYDELDIDGNTLIGDNLRDPKFLTKTISSYADCDGFNEDQRERMKCLVEHYLTVASSDSRNNRNVKWNIKSLEFENLFSYGENNRINFENMSGITGILGSNRSGKSSIVGALMYALFNTTDRGPISNLHVVNARKTHGMATVVVDMGNRTFKIERQTVKHTTSRGISPVTHVNLYELDVDGENTIRDHNGLQRSDTDKIIKRMIGTPEDFMMTSLSSQGDINRFIMTGATQRKAILTRFLGLRILDTMYDLVKKDSAGLKAQVSKLPDISYEMLIEEQEVQISQFKISLATEKRNLVQLRNKYTKLSLRVKNPTGIVTDFDIQVVKERADAVTTKIQDLEFSLASYNELIEENKEQLQKIRDVKQKFPLIELRTKKDELLELKNNIGILGEQQRGVDCGIDRLQNSIRNLSDVPCGDKFPTCKFICDSYQHKEQLPIETEKLKNILSEIAAKTHTLESAGLDKINKHLSKYDDLLRKESNENDKLTEVLGSINSIESELISHYKVLDDTTAMLSDLKEKQKISKQSKREQQIVEQLHKLTAEINTSDAQRISMATELGRLSERLEQLERDRNDYRELSSEWEVYEALLKALSKRGLPNQMLKQLAPVINSEVSRVLHGVVEFTVRIETSLDKNAMDIVIDYGDSNRVIELASGMEKMISSLALRVALINISTLPKTDMFIIDEGFGALDESNVESCNRMLTSLKRWFKNIIVITHVDAVKDVVDNVLEITRDGVDARVTHN